MKPTLTAEEMLRDGLKNLIGYDADTINQIIHGDLGTVIIGEMNKFAHQQTSSMFTKDHVESAILKDREVVADNAKIIQTGFSKETGKQVDEIIAESFGHALNVNKYLWEIHKPSILSAPMINLDEVKG